MEKISVISFIRVSTEEQGDTKRAGISRQKIAIKKAKEKYNLTILKEYQLIDVSGANIINTPEVHEIIHLMRTKQISGILAADVDRVLRAKDFSSFQFLQECIISKSLIYLPDRIIDLTTQQGFFDGAIQAIFGGNELRQIIKRIHQAKEAKRKAGKFPTNELTLPAGVQYDREKERFYYDGIESVKIKQMFNLFDKEQIHNYAELGRRFGYSIAGIKVILQNTIYIGIRTITQKRGEERYLRKDGRQAERKKVNRSSNQIIKVKVIDDPLIPVDQFKRVQKIILQKKKLRNNKPNRFKFNGKLYCSLCGAPLYASAGGKNPRKDYYVCKRKKHPQFFNGKKCDMINLRRDVLDPTVESFLSSKLSSKIFVKKLIKHMGCDAEKLRLQEDIQIQEGLMEKLKTKKHRLIDVYTDGTIDEDSFRVSVTKIDRDLMIGKDQLKELYFALNAGKGKVIKDTLELIQGDLKRYKRWSPDCRKQFVKKHFDRFVINPNAEMTSIHVLCGHSYTRRDMDSLPLPA